MSINKESNLYSRRTVLVLILISALWTNCSQQNPNGFASKTRQITNPAPNAFPTSKTSQIDTLSLPINLLPQGDYSYLKKRIVQERDSFKVAYHESNSQVEKYSIIECARSHLYEILINEIVPFWYGIQWDFNGYTDNPNKGKISCSYFVSTTLRDAGFNLNRYVFAQQKPEWEAATLELGSDLTIIENPDRSPATVPQKLIRAGITNGLYFVGLDNHVGYLLYLQGEYYFINSNHIKKEVRIEKAQYSTAFRSSKYWIAGITSNDSLISCWINDYPIEVVISDEVTTK